MSEALSCTVCGGTEDVAVVGTAGLCRGCALRVMVQLELQERKAERAQARHV